jgi:hypothetical protein
MTALMRSGHSEFGAAHRDGAVADVLIKHTTDRVVKVAVAGQEMSERGVAVTVLGFGGRNNRIASDLRAGTLCSQESLDGAACVSGERQQTVGDDQGTGIDEWITRDSVLVLELDERIERGARWLASNPGPQRQSQANGRLVAFRRGLHGVGHQLADQQFAVWGQPVSLPTPTARAWHGAGRRAPRSAERRIRGNCAEEIPVHRDGKQGRRRS